MPAQANVELDIFSGMPNPTWSLTSDEIASFVRQLASLPPRPARELAGNLGYRGFIIQVTQGQGTQVVRIQTGFVHISAGGADAYADDRNRVLERWVLDTGRPHLRTDILQIVEREFR